MSNRTVLTNARIWTSDKKNVWAEAIAYENDTITFVGNMADLSIEDGDSVIDLKGRMVMPTMLDSHTHVGAIAKSMWCLLFEPAEYESMDQVMGIVKAYAEEHSKEEVPYIYAYSCPTELIDTEKPDRYFMDKYVSDRPVLLCDANYHRCVVNSKMLELMEIDASTPYDYTDSKNYDRFEDNTPTGVIQERVHEFNGDIEKMYDKLGWYPPSEADTTVLLPVLEIMNSFGLCGLHDGFNATDDILKGLKEIEKQGKLHHYFCAIPQMTKIDDIEEAIDTAKKWKAEYEDEYIRVNCIKIFLDGTNELATGAYVEPLINDPNNYGIMNMSEDDLVLAFRRLSQEKLDCQIHLVGDRSFRTALDAAERAKKEEAEEGREFACNITLLHCELTHKDDRKRPAEIGVFINFTPIWAVGLFGDGSKQYLGEERYNSMYAFNEMIESGALVNFSTDLVDEEGLAYANPFVGMEIGHTRVDEVMLGTDIPREPVEECLSIENLLYGYTINNAIGMGIDSITGSLETGKKANLCILSDNLFEVPKNKIREIEPVTVIFEGKAIKGELKNEY